MVALEPMTTPRFAHYQLRSTDPDAARTFYVGVMGEGFWTTAVSLAPLPERAAARGAPPHWAGHLGVPDVEMAVSRIAASGGEQLGPSYPGANGGLEGVVRDPFGAVLVVSGDTVAPRAEPVAWHLLLVSDEARAFDWYRTMFGWVAAERVDLGDRLGRHQRFRWEERGPLVGSVADLARRPHVHPQWLFCFEVARMAPALERVGRLGGQVIDPTMTPEGDLVSACEDPQGAAFALYQWRSG